MARAIIVLRNDLQPCPFDDEGETPFTDEQIANFLAMDNTVEIVTCPHHEAIVMSNLPAGYTYTHATAGQVKGVIHAQDEEPVIPDGEPHAAPPGVTPEQAEAELAEWEAANPGAVGPRAVANTTDEIGGEDVADLGSTMGTPPA